MLSSQNEDQLRLPAVLVYTVLGLSLAPLAYLLVGGSVAPSDAALFQGVLEWSTAVASFITAVLGYLYLRVRADALVLTIVLAAFASGSWDALNSMVALGIVEVSSDINRFAPLAWVISRMLKATVLIAGTVYVLGLVSPRLRLGVIWIPTLVLGTLVLGGTFLYLALREGLPGTFYPDAFVTRPWDLPPLVLFALSGLILYPALLRVQPSLLAGALWLSTVPDTLAQIHVSIGSAYVHDGHFVAAHFLKCLASVVPCIGIAIFFARAFRRETTTAADLGAAVTELKSVEEQLRAEKARLTQLTDNIREVFWVAASDGSEMYYVSPAYEEIFGLTSEALLERPDAFLEVVHPEDQEVMTDLLSRDIQDDFEIEFRILRRGELRWLRTRGFPIRDEAGAVYRLAGITEDISDHKRSAEALMKSEARNRALLQAMPDLMFRLNRQGVILDYHARDDIQLYRPPSEFLGRNVTEVHAELGPRILASVRDTLETGVMKSMEYRMAIGDQVSDFEARFVRSSEDEVLSVIREITEQKRLERALLDTSNREQQRIGHDLHDGLSQQLTGIALLCRVLHQQLEAKGMEEAAGAARIEDLVEEAIGQTRNLARGLAPVELEEGGLSAALEELAASVENLHSIRCDFRGESELTIDNQARATHIYRIAHEAVTNALKHGTPSKISIELTRLNGTLTLSVADNGKGLSQNPTSRSGMGFHIMRYRARMLDGTLDIRPTRKGGTTVTCQCPSTETT